MKYFFKCGRRQHYWVNSLVNKSFLGEHLGTLMVSICEHFIPQVHMGGKGGGVDLFLNNFMTW